MIVTHAENRAWTLKIRDVRETDKGWYMCQVNTDPMKSQMAYLDVVVPPDILDYPTSTDMVVKEGSNMTMKCQATGSPTPTITFRREDGEPIMLSAGYEGMILLVDAINIVHFINDLRAPFICFYCSGQHKRIKFQHSSRRSNAHGCVFMHCIQRYPSDS